MTDTFGPPPGFAAKALVPSMADYEAIYKGSLADPEAYWAEAAKRYHWERPWDTVLSANLDIRLGPISVKWFAGATTNISVNCLDRHLPERGEKTALIWEGNDRETRSFTYRELHAEVCRCANALAALGIAKGDRVALYMPNIPELAIAVLATARLGAVHVVVFGGFSAASLAQRLTDTKACALITADSVKRGAKTIPLKATADEALTLAAKGGHEVGFCLVVRRSGDPVDWDADRDHWWHETVPQANPERPPEWMEAEEPLFVLHTSGSTGAPKGLLHTVGGYMVYAGETFRHVFDHRDTDIYWCTADIGWITGHTYIIYGPLLEGATTLLFEGIPTHPDPGRFWEMVARHKVTVFYTAPTAIRALACQGEEWVTGHDLSTLRLLGTVGEPIDPEAWRWYHRLVGSSCCPIVDTWWQTETGGILISPLPGATRLKPGFASLPLFGIAPAILNPATGAPLQGECEGVLAFSTPWPGMARSIWGDHERYEATYFTAYPGHYFTGDGCRRDADGYHRITGRVDDVLNVAGHRLGTAEIEGAIDAHALVSESAVVGYPHPIKGDGIHAFVILLAGATLHEGLVGEIKAMVRSEIGPIATPDVIQICPGLPKTRSGKIMRRILRLIAAGQTDDLGDTSTLADPSVVDSLTKQ